MWVGKKKLGRKLDGRYKLTEEEETALLEEINAGVLKDSELGLKYGVSRSKVYLMRHPKVNDKKKEANRQYQKENRNKDKQDEANRKLLLKKRALTKQDML
jgi:hypothetical protein